jgi:hypothetical protein
VRPVAPSAGAASRRRPASRKKYARWRKTKKRLVFQDFATVAMMRTPASASGSSKRFARVARLRRARIARRRSLSSTSKAGLDVKRNLFTIGPGRISAY